MNEMGRPTRQGLSLHDYRVLKFIQAYIDEHGYAPTMREIVEGTALTSTCTVRYCLGRLHEREQIIWTRRIARGIVLP